MKDYEHHVQFFGFEKDALLKKRQDVLDRAKASQISGELIYHICNGDTSSKAGKQQLRKECLPTSKELEKYATFIPVALREQVRLAITLGLS